MNKFYIIIVFFLVFQDVSVKSQNNPYNLDLNWETDKSMRAVSLSEFTALMNPDGIPSLDFPMFLGEAKAMEVFFEHEPVIAIEKNGISKAYPLSVLMYHEIANDNLGDLPILVTYCPLCNAAIVFDRRLKFDDKSYLLEFGVSGMLRKSDLVMYDRQTQSWWQQFTGEAMVGELTGAKLSFINSQIISLSEFFQNYPEGQILSTETGYLMEYGINPYANYDDIENNQPFLFQEEVDDRLPAMERVIDIKVDGKYKIYPLSIVGEKEVINDSFLGQPIVLFYSAKTLSVLNENNISESKSVGSVTAFDPRINDTVITFKKSENGFEDTNTGSTWNITGICTDGHFKGMRLRSLNHGNNFAFAWLAFYPDSEIYEK